MERVKKTKPNRLTGLDGLRGLAALLVVLFHFLDRYEHTGSTELSLNYGYMGVHLFFIISGFVIHLTLDKVRGAADFLCKRASRLYPAYWAGVILTAFSLCYLSYEPCKVSLFQLLVNITMFQGFVRVAPIDGVYWTLTVELCFYLLMAIVLVFGQVKRMPIVCLAWLIASLIWQKLFMQDASGIMRMLFFPLITEYAYLFCTGIVFYRIYNKRNTHVDWIILSFAVISAFSFLSYQELLVLTILVSLFSVVVFSSNRLESIFSANILVWLGGVSYSWYLIHQNIGYIIMDYSYALGADYLLSVLAAFGGTLGIAYLINKFMEVPGSRWMRAKLEACKKVIHNGC